MTPTDHDLLRWVAEFLGWKYLPPERLTPAREEMTRECWKMGDRLYSYDLAFHLQSWHGIGLVVEAMEKRDYWLELLSGSDPPWYASFFGGGKIQGIGQSDQPWLAVFHAARKAVGTEGGLGALDD